MSLPPDVTDAETVALIYDETDGLGFYAEFGLVSHSAASGSSTPSARYSHSRQYAAGHKTRPRSSTAS